MFLLLLVILAILFAMLSGNLNVREKMTTLKPEAALVYNSLIVAGFSAKIAKFATAQSAHETGNFTSLLFTKDKNCFGMTFDSQSLAIGNDHGYCVYNSVLDSCKDLKKWYLYHRANIFVFGGIINSIDAYVHFLKQNKYFEASENIYLSACEYFYNLYFSK